MDGTILVTGGTGTLGRLVVDRLLTAGRTVRVLSRHTPPPDPAPAGRGWAVGDLLSGEGVAEAVRGAGTIVHCATSSNGKKDVAATGRLLAAAREAGTRHLVYISIVGCDRVPFSYFKGKQECERLVENSRLPYTILRATQFHDFVRAIFDGTSKLPLMLAPAFSYQTISAAEVADRLAALALGGPSGRVTDMGGPQVREATELARVYLRAQGRSRKVVGLRLPGRTFRAFREGGHLTASHAVGRGTFEDHLAETAKTAAR
ncbi:SDR family oxidoreductase [Streptomyces sp. H51]|uniref:SDR family oxidoreductase n=1 Tax=Streptomyces sp. H51 TaxID=3111770 RepID=UPI002D7A39A0|nr:NAD(P)H-binding protein [Streptomyces sp. H51]